MNWIYSDEYIKAKSLLKNSNLNNMLYGIVIGIKSSIMAFIFIWVRASFPRIRFDQLMSFCWTVLLPILLDSLFLYLVYYIYLMHF